MFFRRQAAPWQRHCVALPVRIAPIEQDGTLRQLQNSHIAGMPVLCGSQISAIPAPPPRVHAFCAASITSASRALTW